MHVDCRRAFIPDFDFGSVLHFVHCMSRLSLASPWNINEMESQW